MYKKIFLNKSDLKNNILKIQSMSSGIFKIEKYAINQKFNCNICLALYILDNGFPINTKVSALITAESRWTKAI